MNNWHNFGNQKLYGLVKLWRGRAYRLTTLSSCFMGHWTAFHWRSCLAKWNFLCTMGDPSALTSHNQCPSPRNWEAKEAKADWCGPGTDPQPDNWVETGSDDVPVGFSTHFTALHCRSWIAVCTDNNQFASGALNNAWIRVALKSETVDMKCRYKNTRRQFWKRDYK